MTRIRQGCLRMCAAGFGAPSDQAIEQLEAGMLALEDLGVGAFPFAPKLREWVGSLREIPGDALAAEYVRLFGSGMDGALCSLSESQHLGQNLVGDPARYAGRIEDLMRRAGFEARHGDRPPDHIIVELELASALCAAEAEAHRKGEPTTDWLERQVEILGILEGWVPGFADLVTERDKTGVFARLCEATVAVVLHDYDFARLLLTMDEDDVVS